MPIAINTNTASITTQRHLDRTRSEIEQAIERLSSGKQINSAMDNAAGLTISHKLSAQVNSLNQAIRNTVDGSSLLQVAEAGLESIHSQLMRAMSLATQGANGTLNENSKQAIQLELDLIFKNIASEISSTKFNDKKLLSNEIPNLATAVTQTSKINRQIDLQNVTTSNDVYVKGIGTSNSSIPEIGNEQGYMRSQDFADDFLYDHYSMTVTTVSDMAPEWSADGTTLIFSSSRTGLNNVTAYQTDSFSNPAPQIVAKDVALSGFQSKSIIGESFRNLRLSASGSTLTLERNTNNDSTVGSWLTLATYTLNSQEVAGKENFSFSPDFSDDIAKFAYSDEFGNIKLVTIDLASGQVSEKDVIHTDDTLNVSRLVDEITLDFEPNLYNMNTQRESFVVYKHNDDEVKTKIPYFDGIGEPPVDSYFTVEGKKIIFHNDARIGAEALDDAQDYYTLAQSMDLALNRDFFSLNIPSNIEIYNMHGQLTGPQSLKIKVGGLTVPRGDYLSHRPANTDVDGVYVNTTEGKIEFFGSYRPAATETIQITAFNDDSDGNTLNGLVSLTIDSDLRNWIDTYNLDQPLDSSLPKPMRVYIGNTEIPYDSTDTNGYRYDPVNGKVILSGSYRPDLNSDSQIRVNFYADKGKNETDKNVYSIPLSNDPVIYNLTSNNAPHSLRVYRTNSAGLKEEVPFSVLDGYSYNEQTNNIDLYGNYRPDASDTKFEVFYVKVIDPAEQVDGRVVYSLDPNDFPFAYSLNDLATPKTFIVEVGGVEIPFDPTKTNGYFFDPIENEIEIYGDARPNANDPRSLSLITVKNVISQTGESISESYEIPILGHGAGYGIPPDNTGSNQSLRVTKNDVDVPYNDISGYTYDEVNQKVILHGDYRPTAANSKDFKIQWIDESSFKNQIPEDSIVNKVYLNGVIVPKASDNNGSGYAIEGGFVVLKGSYRPDAGSIQNPIDMRVEHFPNPGQIRLSTSGSVIPDFILEELPHLRVPLSKADITIHVNNTKLADDQFSFIDPYVELDFDAISINSSPITIDISYNEKFPSEFENNAFSFQVGDQQGDLVTSEFKSLEGMIIDIFKTPIPNALSLGDWSNRIQSADSFITKLQAEIGAVENRLGHTVNNLMSSVEKHSTTQSAIEDADYAIESANLAKAQVTQQAATAMLSQANASLQDVINLLK